MLAREKTKERRIEEAKQVIQKGKEKLAKIEADNDDPDPDEYLAEAMAKM
jgi:hypothetical protein